MKATLSGFGALLVSLAALAIPAPTDAERIAAAATTDAVDKDADDPAVWLHPTDRSKSLILGTCKGGGLYSFGLSGKLVQAIRGLNHLNNVDVEYGFELGGKKVDIAVATERGARQLRVFTLAADTGHLTDATGATGVFEGEEGERAAPMGVALYKRPKDGAIFAFVSRKEGPKQGYIWQYRLSADAKGTISASKVREVGAGTGDEIEALAVDDELGYLYCSEEKVGVHKYHADPAHRDAGQRLALFGQSGFMQDREGIGIHTGTGGKGYIVVSDQGDGESEYHVYARQGTGTDPHDHSELLASFRGGADSTDGLEVASTSVGRFTGGMLVVMNSKGKNFMMYRWTDVARLLASRRR